MSQTLKVGTKFTDQIQPTRLVSLMKYEQMNDITNKQKECESTEQKVKEMVIFGSTKPDPTPPETWPANNETKS